MLRTDPTVNGDGEVRAQTPTTEQSYSMQTINHDNAATGEAVQDADAAEVRFAIAALPLRADLLRTASRYTRNRYDAEDLVQETYARAWTRIETFQPGSNMRAWMSRIMVSIWIDMYRRSTRGVSETPVGSLWEEHSAHGLTATPSAEDVWLQNHADPALEHCLGTLPMPAQAVVFYADVCQLSLKDVAAIERIPLGTVMSRRHRAHRHLRAQLIAGGHHRREERDGSTGPASTLRSAGADPVVRQRY